MYEQFFGLNRSPFQLSPDPSFVVATAEAKEVLSAIYCGISRRKGFTVLTGEVGTGKTLIIRCLLELLRRQNIPCANIFNPKLSSLDFLRYLAFDLGIRVENLTKGDLLQALYRFLMSQVQQGLTTVIVVDESHQLNTAVLEEIRLLTNLETAQQKLVQVLLVGQPEFEATLESFEFRQLKQRVAIRCHLGPLNRENTAVYIRRRLALAGANSHADSIFSEQTIDAVYRYSLGVPRIINNVCDQALTAAYARQISAVTPEIIEEVAFHFKLHTETTHQGGKTLSPTLEQIAAARWLLQSLDRLNRSRSN
jgi:general secretion pathway protein A